MGAGASAAPYEGGDVTDEHVTEFKTSLEKLKADDKTSIANLMSYEGDIGEASEDDLKAALSKTSEEDRKMIAGLIDTYLTCYADLDAPAAVEKSVKKHPHENCKEFSAKLADLIANKDEPCEMKPITDFFAWPNEFESFDTKSDFQTKVDSKARGLVNEYETVMPGTYATKKQMLDGQTELLNEYEQILKDTRDNMTKEIVGFITERDKDGNGIISQEECQAIGKALFETEDEIPADNPLMSCVGKPIAFMADLLVPISAPVQSNEARVKYCKESVAEKQAEADAVKEVNSLAYYPDLLAKTVEVKEYLDSLTKEQFDEALAAHTKSWDSIMNGAGIDKSSFTCEGIVEVETTETLVPEGDSAEAAPEASPEAAAEAPEAAPEAAAEAAPEEAAPEAPAGESTE